MKQKQEEVVSEEAKPLTKEQRLRKAVYSAIVALSECIEEEMLLRMLNNLDQSSWMEVVEERYLGRICGFPLCNNQVEMKKSQKYRIDLRSKKVFERSAEIDKFCSQSCFLRSAAIKAQLEVEPLWIRGDERIKAFDLNAGIIEQQQRNFSDVEFIEDQHLITSLGTLKIGDTAESEDDDDDDGKDHTDDEIKIDEGKRSEIDAEPYTLCRSNFISKLSVDTTNENSNDSIFNKDSTDIIAKMDVKADKNHHQKLSENEKLMRIRNKYSQNKFKRPPKIIAAKPLSSQCGDKLSTNFYKTFEETLSEWCGAETIRYLQYHRSMNFPDKEDSMVVETRSVISQFYAGDRWTEKNMDNIFLPSVDSVDQAKQRVSVLVESLKPSWRLLEGKLGISGCGQQALEIISTFQLSATNVVVERKICNFAVAVIFYLLAYCNTSSSDFHPYEDILPSEFGQYLECIGCDANYYSRILSSIMNKLE